MTRCTLQENSKYAKSFGIIPVVIADTMRTKRRPPLVKADLGSLIRVTHCSNAA